MYLQLIQKVLNEGKSSIMLVPEISLTPQTVDRFIARFGQDNIAVLHSKLSEIYDLSKIDYKNMHTDIELICPEHGSFLISPKGTDSVLLPCGTFSIPKLPFSLSHRSTKSLAL